MTGVKSASTAHNTIHTFVFEAVVTAIPHYQQQLLGWHSAVLWNFPLVKHGVIDSQLHSHHMAAPDLLSPG